MVPFKTVSCATKLAVRGVIINLNMNERIEPSNHGRTSGTSRGRTGGCKLANLNTTRPKCSRSVPLYALLLIHHAAQITATKGAFRCFGEQFNFGEALNVRLLGGRWSRMCRALDTSDEVATRRRSIAAKWLRLSGRFAGRNGNYLFRWHRPCGRGRRRLR